jgi:hypothetical protein
MEGECYCLPVVAEVRNRLEKGPMIDGNNGEPFSPESIAEIVAVRVELRKQLAAVERVN